MRYALSAAQRHSSFTSFLYMAGGIVILSQTSAEAWQWWIAQAIAIELSYSLEYK